MIRYSKLSGIEVDQLLTIILKQIDFISEDILELKNRQTAYELTSNVDGDDISFVALAWQINGLLWTGDKKLTAHLKSIGFDRVADTKELFELLKLN